LKRAGIFTIGDIIDCIAGGKLSQIRNLGRKTVSEIQTTVLVFGYDKLTVSEKRQFFCDVLQMNCV
jgi:DNA-directed RNA polymerase alpha subunit